MSESAWPRRDVCLAALLLGIVAAAALFFRLGAYRTLGSHEAFAAVPARQMLNSGDWTVPRYAGLPRLEKPPLPYWVVAASGAIFGEVNEWTARLPAALAALGLALLMGCWAARWYGAVAGYAAALVQVTSLYAITFGRKAEVDMLLWLCMTAAMFLIAHQPADERGRRAFARWTGIGALLAVAWLAKFHYGLTLVLAPTAIYYIVQRRWRAFGQLANPAGLLMLAAAVFVWPWLVLQQVPDAWEVWRHETVGRALGDLGQEPLWFYVPHVAWMAMPWLPLALAGVPASWRRAWRDADHRERFLWIWFATQVLIVSLAPDKHKHYVAPALPVFSLLAGRVVARMVEAYRQGAWRLTTNPALLLGLGGLIIAVAGSVVIADRWPGQSSVAVMGAVVYIIGGWTSLAAFAIRRPRAAAVAATAQFAVSICLVIGWIVPAADRHRPMVEFTRSVASAVPADEPLLLYRMDQDPAVFYLGDGAQRVETQEALRTALARYGRVRVMTFAPYVVELGGEEQRRVLHALLLDPDVGHPKEGPRYLVEVTAEDGVVPAGYDEPVDPAGGVTPASASRESAPAQRR